MKIDVNNSKIDLTIQEQAYNRGYVTGVKTGRELELDEIIEEIKNFKIDFGSYFGVGYETCNVYDKINDKLDEVISTLKKRRHYATNTN